MTHSGLTARDVTTRFLWLRGLRWLPTGLLIPVLVLLLLERGFSLADIGLVTAAQGFTVLLLELPTGALSDAVGRRPVLVLAALFQVCALALLVVADSLPVLVLVFALAGAYRALESGPLDAWYVDTALAADPGADLERGFARSGVVIGLAIGTGSLLSSGLVLLGPVAGIDALVLPLLASLVLEAVHVGAVLLLMTEHRRGRDLAALRASVRTTPTLVRDAVGLIRLSKVLLALVGVELLWGFGMTAFETFTPPRLAQVIGDTDHAAALFGPVSTAAWLVSAAGAAAVPALAGRIGAAYTGAALRIAQGLTVVGIALTTGAAGVIAAYLLTMAVHGAANPVHQGLLHRAVEGPTHRATVVSANSLTAQLGGALGGIALGALADATSLSTAILAGAAVLAAAAPLYLVARRPAAVREPVPSG